MSAQVYRIAHCVGCRAFGRVLGRHEDACAECLHRRGARWLELARRVRRDPVFAALVYRQLPEAWRDRFEESFGMPRDQ